MDLHHLRVFQAAARTGSFTAAGRELRLSQSTVSLHIKQMEEELGCGLFLRSSKQVSLSQAGQELLLYADRILQETKNATLALQEFSAARRGTIRMGVGATTLIYLLPTVLAEFRGTHPMIEIVVVTGTTEFLLQELHGSRLDFALVMSPSQGMRSLQCAFVMDEDLVVTVRKGHPLANRAALSPRDLQATPWISHLRGTAMHVVQQNFFQEQNVEPQVSMEMENMEAIKRLVAAGVGVALLPLCSLSGVHGHGLVGRRVKGKRLGRQLFLACQDWSAQPPATRRLANSIVTTLGSGAADPMLR